MCGADRLAIQRPAYSKAVIEGDALLFHLDQSMLKSSVGYAGICSLSGED